MATPMSSSSVAGVDEVEPYSIHVSSRYLDLTKNKLELTRMPRELQLDEQKKWSMGTPKSALEPLVDYWLESYDWRAQEACLNSTLRQYRTTIQYPPPPSANALDDQNVDIEAAAAIPPPPSEQLRIHFLHHRSTFTTAIPLLYIHTWPGSFLEISRCVDMLASPPGATTQQAGGGLWRDPVAFHVITPSLPGFGFSDASAKEGFGMKETAEVLVTLMKRLGYSRFVIWGDGWGFKVARMVAIHHSSHVAAIYTTRIPDLRPPQALKHKDAWLKYNIARLTGARYPWLSFGYMSSDFGATEMSIANEPAEPTAEDAEHDIEMSQVQAQEEQQPLVSTWTSQDSSHRYHMTTDMVSKRPQTLAYALCDSPAGLLSLILDALKPNITHTTPAPITPMSRRRSHTVVQHGMPTIDETSGPAAIFTPAEILNWTMMHWLPGPEAAFRWLRQAEKEECYDEYSEVPLGISWYASASSSSNHGKNAQPAKLVRGVSSLERLKARAQSTRTSQDAPTSESAAGPPATSKSPIWASAMQNLKWIKRRNEEPASSVTAWEKSAEAIQDIREFFAAGRNDGWLGL